MNATTRTRATIASFWVAGASLFLLIGCADDAPSEGVEETPAEAFETTEQAMECRPATISEETAAVMTALAPHCEGCHREGNRGYFRSLSAFQELLVSDPRLVTPGDPDASELILLLEGNGTGAFSQMPIGVNSYADLAEADASIMPVAEIRDWVIGLAEEDEPVRSTRPDPEASRIRRMTAAQMKRTLYQQLSLSNDDFFSQGQRHGIPMLASHNDDRYPLAAIDELPAPFHQPPAARFTDLGGGTALDQTRDDDTVSPTAVLTLTQLSQSWCRTAIAKADNPALFPAGTTRTDDDANVRATIERWGLHFHGQRLDGAEVDRLHTTLFTTIRDDAGDAEPAWVGLCSYFIRHPHWIVY